MSHKRLDKNNTSNFWIKWKFSYFCIWKFACNLWPTSFRHLFLKNEIEVKLCIKIYFKRKNRSCQSLSQKSACANRCNWFICAAIEFFRIEHCKRERFTAAALHFGVSSAGFFTAVTHTPVSVEFAIARLEEVDQVNMFWTC